MKTNITLIKTKLLYLFCFLAGVVSPLSGHTKEKPKPKIINVVNFIRLLEPRDPKITEEVLYQTVVKQIEMMKKIQFRWYVFIAI